MSAGNALRDAAHALLDACHRFHSMRDQDIATAAALVRDALEAQPAGDAGMPVVMLWRDSLPDGRYDSAAKNESLVRLRDAQAAIAARDARVAELEARINALEAEIKPLDADWSRLDWMQFHGAKVCWGNDDEVCEVQWSDRDGVYKTGPFIDWRAAIDAAIGGHFKEIT